MTHSFTTRRAADLGQQQGYQTDVAYAVVPTNGVNTLIEGSYASGPGTGVGIEMAGSGEVTGNFVKDFWYGVIVYNGGFNVHDNALVNQSIETVLNYGNLRSEEHTSELQSLMRNSYAVFFLTKKKNNT